MYDILYDITKIRFTYLLNLSFNNNVAGRF